LNGFIETAPLDTDPVFGALQLSLQITEVLGRAQFGISFGNDQQA
jgi:hypothetical protein